MHRRDSFAFRPKARLLSLLGDQLIRNSRIAAFELVKNAYDADATYAKVVLKNIEKKRASIVVKDDGTGMDWDTVTKVWLVPGTDNRKRQREQKIRTARFNRMPLGEKGVGRFAAHKLGSGVRMITRMRSNPEIVVDINWKDFETEDYLDSKEIVVYERSPLVFKGKSSGTRITIKNLREQWTRGKTRNLHRAISSICSPFDSPTDFKPSLKIEPNNGWLKGLLRPKRVLKTALFRANCEVKDNFLSYRYVFKPPSEMTKVKRRVSDHRGSARIKLPKKVRLSSRQWMSRIGPLEFKLYIWDRSRDVLPMQSKKVIGLQGYLDKIGGVRVYRDGVRVYDYGEKGNDWLNLGGRRVNVPVSRLSNNLIIGAVNLDSERSEGLVEKTNREGFIENEDYGAFQNVVMYALEQIENERNFDKERVRRAYDKKKATKPVLDEIAELRSALEERDLLDELGSHVDRLEGVYIRMRDQLLTSAGSGLALLVVIHELELGIRLLTKSAQRRASRSEIVEIANHLAELLDGITILARTAKRTKQAAKRLISQAITNVSYRLESHGIQVVNGIEEGTSEDFTVRCSRRLIVATIMNIIDNSIFWLADQGADKKYIYLGTARMPDGFPAIVAADSGPGFSDAPDLMVQPFWSRKPDGMGLGLYIADMVMKRHGGRLEFPDPNDLKLNEGIESAIVALVFEGSS